MSYTNFSVNMNSELETVLDMNIAHIFELDTDTDLKRNVLFCCVFFGCILLLLIEYLYIQQIPKIMRQTPSKHLSRTFSLCGIYSIIAAASFTSMLIPNAYVFCDSICHFAFLLCAYQYFCLIIDYAGGEANLLKITAGVRAVNLQTPPLCCCLKFLKPLSLTKQTLIILRLLCLQMPIIQGILLASLNVLNSVSNTLYNSTLIFFVPFIVGSILIGVWSLQITARMISPYFEEYKILEKYFAIQLVLIMCKLQPAIIQLIWFLVIDMEENTFATNIMRNVFVQLLILMETVLLSLFANKIYSIPGKQTQRY